MIGLIAHSSKANAKDALASTVKHLRKAGAEFLMEKETSALLGLASELSERQLAKNCEVLMVLGGDGTILRVLHRLGTDLRPIFGVNIGSLGFLTCAGREEIPRAVQSLVNGDYILSSRHLLKANVSFSDKTSKILHGLNDVVISRGERSELVKVEVTIDGVPFTEYNADGLIVATPTGSTAYSLSAGGPILMPQSGCLVITPICPHVLTNRSTVVNDSSVIEVKHTQEKSSVFVSVDGQGAYALGPGDSLKITRSSRQLPLAMLPGRLFPEILREKLKWSGSNI